MARRVAAASTTPAWSLDTVVVAGFGLAALAWRGTAANVAGWCSALLGGVALVTPGTCGPFDVLLADDQRACSTARWRPLRNVHKFDVVLRLPLWSWPARTCSST